MRNLLKFICIVSAVALAGAQISKTSANAANPVRDTNTAPQAPAAPWNALVDDFVVNVYLKFSPTGATALGLHQYDNLLEDYSRAGVDQQIAVLRQYEKRVASFDATRLSETEAGDREMLLGNMRSSLLTLETIRPWEKNPDGYSSGIANGVYVIVSRKFAPAG